MQGGRWPSRSLGGGLRSASPASAFILDFQMLLKPPACGASPQWPWDTGVQGGVLAGRLCVTDAPSRACRSWREAALGSAGCSGRRRPAEPRVWLARVTTGCCLFGDVTGSCLYRSLEQCSASGVSRAKGISEATVQTGSSVEDLKPGRMKFKVSMDSKARMAQFSPPCPLGAVVAGGGGGCRELLSCVQCPVW